MKRERAFLATTQTAIPKKRKLSLSLAPAQPKLNRSQSAQVKRMIKSNEETKYFRPGVIVSSCSNVANITALGNIAQGLGGQDRIGSQVTFERVKVKLDAIVSDSTNIIRFILFKWKENDTFTVPTALQILSNGLSGAPDVWSFYNDETSQSYQILYDKVFVGSNGGSSDTIRQFAQRNIKLGHKVKFFSDSTTTGTNKLYQLNISDSAAVVHPTLSWITEIQYTDA